MTSTVCSCCPCMFAAVVSCQDTLHSVYQDKMHHQLASHPFHGTIALRHSACHTAAASQVPLRPTTCLRACALMLLDRAGCMAVALLPLLLYTAQPQAWPPSVCGGP
jgi:hypothetical protein